MRIRKFNKFKCLAIVTTTNQHHSLSCQSRNINAGKTKICVAEILLYPLVRLSFQFRSEQFLPSADLSVSHEALLAHALVSVERSRDDRRILPKTLDVQVLGKLIDLGIGARTAVEICSSSYNSRQIHLHFFVEHEQQIRMVTETPGFFHVRPVRTP